MAPLVSGRRKGSCHPADVSIHTSAGQQLPFIYTSEYYFSPLQIGTKQISSRMPANPTIIPGIRLPHTITKHMPIPKANAPIIPRKIVPTAFPSICIGALCSIFLQTKTVINAKTSPTQPTAIPGLKAFHSATIVMHIPIAKKIQLIVPKINAAKLLFFMIKSS